MPRVSPAQTTFTGGEFSPRTEGRIDSDRYRTGLATCENYAPLPQGPLVRRGGTEFVANAKYRTKETRLVPFTFSTVQSYIIEFGDLYCRFFKDNAIITNAAKTITGATAANPVVITSNAHGFTTGDRVIITGVGGMTELNNREFRVGTTTANTFELGDTDGLSGINGLAYTAYTSGGSVASPYEVTTTYAEADLSTLYFTQSDDILYITHPSYAPKKLSRTGHTNWTLAAIDFQDGPYLPLNTGTTTITPSAATGTGVTLTASAALFASTDVGRLVRIRRDATNWGWCKITAYTDTTHVTADVKGGNVGTGAVTTWRLGLWSDTTGYPACSVFHEDRLWFGGTRDYPLRVDSSNSGDYENFATTAMDSVVVASNAISISLNANNVNSVRWMSSDEKGLQIGTSGGEWVLRPSSLAEALTATNASAKKTSSYGSAPAAPVQVGKAALFIQAAGKKVREMRYFYEVDGFEAPDLTELAEHIAGSSKFKYLAYQQEPLSVIWAVREDGVLAGCSYKRETDSLVVGWHRHPIGGYADAAENPAEVESIAVIPSSDGGHDELWLVVKRYIAGAAQRHVEYMTPIFGIEDELRDAFQVDAGLTYDNPISISAITQDLPGVVTANSHGFSNGDKVLILGVKGMDELNDMTFLVANVAANTFELQDLDGNDFDTTGFDDYVSGGYVRKLISSVSGLWHLNGSAVDVLADGAYQRNTFVNSGRITLSPPAATVHIGLPFRSRAKLLRFDAGAANGTSFGKTRRINRLGLFLHNTLGLKLGMNFDEMDELTFRTAGDELTRAVPLYSGIRSEQPNSTYDFENQVCLEQSGPFPGTIIAVFPDMETEDR